MNYHDYAALPHWRWSHIALMRRSPLAVWHARTIGDTGNTASRRILRAIHSAVLTPNEFNVDYALCDVRRDERTAKYQEWLADHPGAEALNLGEWEDIIATRDAIWWHAPASEIFSVGAGEQTLKWVDKETGIQCKARLDWLDPERGIVADLKTYGTVDEREVGRQVAKFQAHAQLAHYVSGCRHVGIEINRVCLIVAQGEDEQDVAVYDLSEGGPDGALYVGEKIRRDYMQRLAVCVERSEWPGAHPAPVDLCLPVYALGDDEITVGSDDGGDAQ